MVSLLQQQLADVVAAKETALATIQNVIAAGLGPTYSISGPDGSENLDMTGYLRLLTEQVKSYTELEKLLLEELQNLQPFQVRHRMRVGGSLISGGRRWW
jgi:hypothetical protein